MSFVRYVAVQLVCYALDMGGFLLAMYAVGAHPVAANVFGKLVSGGFGFFAHRTFTFRAAAAGGAGTQAVLYFGLLAINIPMSSGILAGLLLLIPQPVVAKFISDVISVGINYWLSKKYVFTAGARP